MNTGPSFFNGVLRATNIRFFLTPSGIQNLAHDNFEGASQLADLVALGSLSIFVKGGVSSS